MRKSSVSVSKFKKYFFAEHIKFAKNPGKKKNWSKYCRNFLAEQILICQGRFWGYFLCAETHRVFPGAK